MKSRLLVLLLILALLLSACNLPASTPESNEGIIFTLAAQTITAAAQTGTQSTSTPIAQVTNTPLTAATTQAPQPGVTVTATSLPCNRTSFVSDVTIPDDTNITVNKAFTKTWRLKNVGSCTWTSSYQLVFDSGDKMGGPDSQQLTNGTVAPGQTIDVSVNLTAPSNPGTYKGNWKIKEPGGLVFALSTGPFWVQIKATAVSEADYPTFKKGDSGDEVFAIQYLLLARGFNLGVDGIFGNETQSTVEDFQTQNNLKEDAIVGPETWKALIIQVSQGKTGPEVRAVQKLLKDKFGYNITVDGIFGPDTANAVKNFQTSKGLTSDGIVGPNTWQRLIND